MENENREENEHLPVLPPPIMIGHSPITDQYQGLRVLRNLMTSIDVNPELLTVGTIKLKPTLRLGELSDPYAIGRMWNKRDTRLIPGISDGSKTVDMSKVLYPWVYYDERGVRGILTEDWISRKKISWPLVPLDDFWMYGNGNNDYLRMKRNDYPFVRNYELVHSAHCLTNNQTVSALVKTNDETVTAIFDTYPYLIRIFEKYYGKVAVCGGLVLRALIDPISYLHGSDCDIFFYNCTEEEVEVILLDCIAMITTIAIANDGEVVTVERKLNVVNVVILYKMETHREDQIRKYQFILRVYQTLDSIIGGFDLGPSMVAFDGKDIYATPLGAWSIMKRALIVDTTRRSTSFEHRIIKYQGMGFGVVFPGLKADQIESKVMKGISNEKEELRLRFNKLRSYMWSLNIGFTYDMEALIGYNGGTGSLDIGNAFELKYFYRNAIKLGSVYFDVNNCFVAKRKRYFNGTSEIPRNAIDAASDYERNTFAGCSFWNNDAYLRSGNLEGVVVPLKFVACEYEDPKVRAAFEEDLYRRINPAGFGAYEHVIEEVSKLFNGPEIHYDKDFITSASNYLGQLIQYNWTNSGERDTQLRLFADLMPQIREIVRKLKNLEDLTELEKFTGELSNILLELQQRMNDNLAIVTEKFKKLTCITKNPQRQWTSSNNPIMRDPRDFYGVENYCPFMIGMPSEVETVLRCIRFHYPKSLIGKNVMEGNLFKMILVYIVRAYCFNYNKDIESSELDADPFLPKQRGESNQNKYRFSLNTEVRYQDEINKALGKIKINTINRINNHKEHRCGCFECSNPAKLEATPVQIPMIPGFIDIDTSSLIAHKIIERDSSPRLPAIQQPIPGLNNNNEESSDEEIEYESDDEERTALNSSGEAVKKILEQFRQNRET